MELRWLKTYPVFLRTVRFFLETVMRSTEAVSHSNGGLVHQQGRFGVVYDTRHVGYGPSMAYEDEGAEVWQEYGFRFHVSNQSYAQKQFLASKNSDTLVGRARTLGKTYKKLIVRQNDLPVSAYSEISYYEGKGREYECSDEHMRRLIQCADPFDIARKLLSQVNERSASLQAQEVLTGLTAMSLAAAGFNGFSVCAKSPSELIGTPSGFQGKEDVGCFKGLFIKKDILARRVQRNMALLNAVKQEGVSSLKTVIDKTSLSVDAYAEQLIHRAKMLIVCTPSETLYAHATEVGALASLANDVEREGVRNALDAQDRPEFDRALPKRSVTKALVDQLALRVAQAEKVLLPEVVKPKATRRAR